RLRYFFCPHDEISGLGGFTAFVRHQFIMLKSWCRLSPFAPRRTGLSIGGNHFKKLQGVPPMKRAPFTLLARVRQAVIHEENIVIPAPRRSLTACFTRSAIAASASAR